MTFTEATGPLSPPPGPPESWFVGSLPQWREDSLGFMERLHAEFGPIAAFHLGALPFVVAFDPPLIEEALVTKNRVYEKHALMHHLTPVLGQGLLMSEGAFWRRQRKLMQPSFSRQALSAYCDVMLRQTYAMLARWKNGASVDLQTEMSGLTIRIAAETLLGVTVEEHAQTIGWAQEIIQEEFSERIGSVFNFPFWAPTPANMRLRSAITALEKIIFEAIETCRSRGADEPHLLARLIQAKDDDGQGMSDQQLRDEAMTLLLAGHETTANAMSWIWALLDEDPEVAEAARRDLQSHVGDRELTGHDLCGLTGVHQIVKEAMRLRPPAYVHGRRATVDTTLGSHRIPAGTNVLLSQWVVQRDPRFYDDPLAFRPQRWTSAFEKQIPRYAYFPFSGGPRVCIGNDFALMEAALITAVVLPRFRFELETDGPVKPWPSITLRPRGGLPAKLHQIA